MSDEQTCKPIEVTKEIRVEIEPNYIWGWNQMDMNERRAALERWANDIRSFFRDHRSMDVNSVTVVPVKQTICSACRHAWEEMIDEDTGEKACAYCGVLLETAVTTST